MAMAIFSPLYQGMQWRQWDLIPARIHSFPLSHLQQKFKTNERHEFCQGLSIEDTWCILKKMRQRVCEREWKEFKEDMSKIPLHLLRYLNIHDDKIVTKI